jgi:hypothetical protein
MSKELVSGLIVDVEHPYREPGRVVLYKLGTSGATWLTPDEAERLCNALQRAIVAAKKEP